MVVFRLLISAELKLNMESGSLPDGVSPTLIYHNFSGIAFVTEMRHGSREMSSFPFQLFGLFTHKVGKLH